ncbi:MAG: hypothetical protein GY711_31725 [bacterium]|nr:hypothetical protein [bacterium]
MATERPSALDELADVLEALSVDYVVGGSLASGAWGEPRSTHDVDILVRLDQGQATELVAAMQERFYIDGESVREAISGARAFNVIHLTLFEKIDVFVAGSGPLDTAQLDRAVLRPLAIESERHHPVTSAEVVVLRKLDWYRRGDEASERQWRDVLAVLRVQGERLDRPVMEELARACGLEDLLARAIQEAWAS